MSVQDSSIKPSEGCEVAQALSCCVQTSVWFPDDPARKALIQRWAIAFVRCAMDHVREDCDLEPHLKVCSPELEQPLHTGYRDGDSSDERTVWVRLARLS